jgi:hypothetical protein
MNRDYVLFNLREAHDELERTLRDIATNPDYGHAEFVVAMGHLYHHVNTAWNARDSSAEEAAECSQLNFDKWRQFPSSDELYLA